jgi:hypothetical protein
VYYGWTEEDHFPMSTNGGSNKRRTRRHPARRTTRVACYKGSLGLGRNIALAIHNVSEEGACITLSELLPVGQEVELHLESIHHRRPVKVQARVVWSSTGENGTHLAGLQFQKVLPFQDLQALSQTL